jgi:hypothetical protein
MQSARAGSPNTEARPSRETSASCRFSLGGPPPAGAEAAIQAASERETPSSCRYDGRMPVLSQFLANAVCWCCAWHPAMQSGRAGSPNTEASIRRLGANRPPLSATQPPSRRASAACSGSPPGDTPPWAGCFSLQSLLEYPDLNASFLKSWEARRCDCQTLGS